MTDGLQRAWKEMVVAQIEVQSRNCPGHEKPWSGQLVSLPRLQSGTYRIQVWSVTC
jgi:hypothetical protein